MRPGLCTCAGQASGRICALEVVDYQELFLALGVAAATRCWSPDFGRPDVSVAVIVFSHVHGMVFLGSYARRHVGGHTRNAGGFVCRAPHRRVARRPPQEGGSHQLSLTVIMGNCPLPQVKNIFKQAPNGLQTKESAIWRQYTSVRKTYHNFTTPAQLQYNNK